MTLTFGIFLALFFFKIFIDVYMLFFFDFLNRDRVIVGLPKIISVQPENFF